jgi:hypothetical protein
MSRKSFTPHYRLIGRAAAWGVFLLGMVYIVVTVLGFLSLKSPQSPIDDPFFFCMELIIILMAPLMVIVMAAIHAYAASEVRVFSIAALLFMTLLAGITSVNHFVVLTVFRHSELADRDWFHVLFAFQWPSVAYALDILAWDWFFALAMLCAAPVFKSGRLEITIRNLMIVSGVLSLMGLIGVPLSNMQVRNVGIIGYGLVAPIIFLLLGIVFGRPQQEPGNTE